MISLHRLADRLKAKWERTVAQRALRRRRPTSTIGRPEEFEGRQLLSATPIGSEFQIDADGSGGVLAGDVDRISDGRSVAVWREDADGSALVLAQMYDANGAAVGDVIEVAEDFASDVAPAVAMAQDGQFVVVWVEDDTLIVGRQFDSAGEALDDEFDIGEVDGDPENIVVDVDMDADGDFVVAWAAGPKHVTLYALYAYDESAVFARRYTKLGAPVEDKFRVDSPTSDDVYLVANPHVAVDADGDFAIGWTDMRENYVHKTVRYHYSGETYEYEYDVLTVTGANAMIRRYQGNNFTQAAVASPAQVVLSATKPNSVVNLQDVDMDSDGDVLVTLTRDSYRYHTVHYSGSAYHYLELKTSELLVQRFSADGGKAKKPKRLIKTKSTSAISSASAALDEDGDFSVAFKVNEPPYIYLSGYGGPLPASSRKQRHSGRAHPRGTSSDVPDQLFVQHFNIKNKADGDAVRLVNTSSGNLTSFSIANRDSGELAVVWSLGTVGDDGEFRGRRVGV